MPLSEITVALPCETCYESGEIQLDVRSGRSFYTCPMCEGDGYVTPEVLAEYVNGFMTHEDAEERIIAMLTGED